VQYFSRRFIRTLFAVQLVALDATPELFEGIVCAQEAPAIKVNFSFLVAIAELPHEFHPKGFLSVVAAKVIISAFTFRAAV
jgi:hypothetical protein